MRDPVALFAALVFVVIGLSHLLQPLAWVEFFAAVRAQGRAGIFLEGFVHLLFGATLVAFGDLRPDLSAAPAIVGALLVVKAAVRFLAPDHVLRAYARLTPAHAGAFRVGGGFALALGGLFAYVGWA